MSTIPVERASQLAPIQATDLSARRGLVESCKAAARWLLDWYAATADLYATARLYERLSQLSDGELERRGLSRETLMADLAKHRARAWEASEIGQPSLLERRHGRKY